MSDPELDAVEDEYRESIRSHGWNCKAMTPEAKAREKLAAEYRKDSGVDPSLYFERHEDLLDRSDRLALRAITAAIAEERAAAFEVERQTLLQVRTFITKHGTKEVDAYCAQRLHDIQMDERRQHSKGGG